MQIKSRNIGKLVRLATLVIAFLTVSLSVSAYSYNRYNASNVINKTAYIIDEAYSIADYYGYWTGSNLSRAVYYNDYAQRQLSRGNYRIAVFYSLRAREYALMVIDGCDEYWDYYYYNNYGWSRTYGYNPYYTGSHGNHYGNYNNYYNNNYNNNHGNNSNYNANRPDNYNDGRGSNGRSDAFDPNKPNNNGTQTGHFTNGSSTKNLNTSNYFNKDEIGLLKELPAETSMENDFKKENKDVKFDDKSVRNNTVLINQNRTKAQSFRKSTPATSRKNIKIAAPKSISEINNSNRNKLIKANKTNKTNNTGTKIINPENNRNNQIDVNRTNINNENKVNNRNQNLENNRINTEKDNINTRNNNNTKRTIEPTTPIKREVKTTESNTRTIKTNEKVKEAKTLNSKEPKITRTR